MSTPPHRRHHFDASESEKDAYALAHAGYTAVRGLEALATYGFDPAEAASLAHSTTNAQEAGDFDAAVASIRAREELRSRKSDLAGSAVVGRPDSQGEQQIAYDVDAWEAMESTAKDRGIPIVGEEDQFRGRHPGNPEADAKARGRYLADLITLGQPVGVLDPLDGSNQAAGMGQRSGWASCAAVKRPNSPALGVCVLCGDGRGFVTDGLNVWLSESGDPDRGAVSRRLDPLVGGHRTFLREHFIIPAAKDTTIAVTAAIMARKPGFKHLAPLGGNPGLLVGMLTAGAAGGVQPKAYAWDHMACYILAAAGLRVISDSSDGDVLTASDIAVTLLEDLAAGRKTGAMYVGRTHQDALRLRDVYAEALARR